MIQHLVSYICVIQDVLLPCVTIVTSSAWIVGKHLWCLR